MTTFPLVINLNGSPPYAQTVTLDGAPVLLTVAWNVYAQRWYVSLNSPNAELWMGPLIASTVDYPIPLAPGVFNASSIRFDADSQAFVVSP